MEGDPCKGLLEKKYIEVKADEKLRRNLSHCLNKRVFNIDNIFFLCSTDSITITFPSEFFTQPFFIHGGRPGNTKLQNFYNSMINLERRLKLGFIVDRNEKPSSTNLCMKVKFTLPNARQGINITIQDLLNHLTPIWSRIRYELGLIGYRIGNSS
jgi:hypothetical protein